MHKSAVILAAGLGTRMKSQRPKVLHRIAGFPMISLLVRAVEPSFDRIVVVTGPSAEAVAQAVAPHSVVVQAEPRGTAHAALTAVAEFGDGLVTIIYGDNPLLTTGTFDALTHRIEAGMAGLALLGTRAPVSSSFGRIISVGNQVVRIVEAAHATEAERAVGLCNVGGFSARARDLRRWLDRVNNQNSKAEYYITDIVSIANEEGARVSVIEAAWEECLGVNSRAELVAAEAAMQIRLRAAALEAGVTLTAPETVFCAADTAFAPDVVVEPNVIFGPGVEVGSGAVIRAFCHLEGCKIGSNTVIGPYARIRPGTVIETGVHIGNFVELKAAQVGAGSKANHLSYLGDSDIGAGTNIGAGTITCNYDGFSKNRTIIGSGVFVGSNVALVAPVRVGDGAMIAAGSVITKDVEADALALARGQQTQKPGRAAVMRLARKKP
jgi:bifunctional UDP-N-acetylglucosamine pyrophosphorylase/glucosamine-1-phosphate N-acetyltransferase